MGACVGAHHLSRKLKAFGHDARLMPAKYVRPYSKGQKNDFRNAETIAEAVQRPTMKFVATKTAILASRASTWPRDPFDAIRGAASIQTNDMK
jgi:transposase